METCIMSALLPIPLTWAYANQSLGRRESHLGQKQDSVGALWHYVVLFYSLTKLGDDTLWDRICLNTGLPWWITLCIWQHAGFVHPKLENWGRRDHLRFAENHHINCPFAKTNFSDTDLNLVANALVNTIPRGRGNPNQIVFYTGSKYGLSLTSEKERSFRWDTVVKYIVYTISDIFKLGQMCIKAYEIVSSCFPHAGLLKRCLSLFFFE